MHKNKNKSSKTTGNAYEGSMELKYAISFTDRIIEIHNEI